MSRIIEAKAVISGEDKLSKVLDGLDRKFKQIGKGAKVSADVDRLSKSLADAKRGMDALDRFRAQQASFAGTRSRYRSDQEQVARLGRELEAARKAAQQFDGVRSFSKSGGIAQEMVAAKKAAADVERQLSGAQRAVKASASAYEAQSAALKGARGDLAGSGVVTGKLVAEQNRLKAAVDGATAAIQRQEALARAEGRMTSGMGAAGRHQADRIAQSRYLTEGMGASGRAAAAQAQAEADAQRQILLDRRQARRDAAMTLAGGAGVYLGHKVHEGTHATLETYRHFDKYKRQTQAFGNFTDDETSRIVDMAIHGGASTRYNDIQWLQGSKALGSRGVKAGSVMKILPEAAQYGQAMGVDLPEAVAGLEGSLFTFRRDLSTPEKAQAAARRTADLQVTAAKAFGLTHHDLKGGYELGGLGAEMSGLGEEKLLAFLGLGKKLNIEGHAQGNAFNSMTAKFLSPTKKGREALASVGIDYGARQQMPERLSVDNFANMIAQQYGAKLDKGARAKLDKAFSDKATFSDPSAFAVAVRGAVKGQVGIQDAKSANKVVGSAERFRQVNVEKVDVNGLFNDIMEKVKDGNLALANAIWGEKQGKRIMAALRDGDVWNESLKKVEHAKEGKARDVSDQMNAGFDGAVARFEGAVKNLETAAGRSWDDDGKGGFLTTLADAAAKATQALAELPRPVLQAGSALAYVGGKVATASGTLALVGAALSLKGSAAALTAAAGRLGMGGLPGKVPGAGAPVGGPAGSAAKNAAAGTAGAGLTVGGVITGGTILGGAAAGAYLDNNLSTSTGQIGDLLRYREKMHADAEATKRLGYGSFNFLPKRDMLPGADGKGSASTTVESSGGGFHDFFWGKRKDSYALPSFGYGTKRMPPPPPDPVPETYGPHQQRGVPLPPQRPLSLGGGPIPVQIVSMPDARLDASAGDGAKRMVPDQRLEATLKPDQVVAKIDSIPPVSGQATVTVDQRTQVDIHVDADFIKATARAEAKSVVASIPLASSGARPGAVSMPGAATTPGAK